MMFNKAKYWVQLGRKKNHAMLQDVGRADIILNKEQKNLPN